MHLPLFSMNSAMVRPYRWNRLGGGRNLPGAICRSQLRGWSWVREVRPVVSQILMQTHSEF